MGRAFVHLSSTPAMAESVGRRHGRPEVILVMAGEMAAAGHLFYRTASEIWLTKSVPPEYLRDHES